MIQIEVRGVQRFTDALHHMPDAAKVEIAKALTNCVKYDVQPKLIGGMHSAFDRPTRWTLNSTFIEAATPAKLEALIHFKDRDTNGVPAGRFLRAQVLGGPRSMKSHERKLAAIGLLPGELRLLPAIGAALDAHGNMHRTQLRAVVAALLSKPASKPRRRGARQSGGGGLRYFVIRPGQTGTHLAPGIYAALGTGGGRTVLPVLIYGRDVAYRQRLDFVAIAEQAIAEGLPRRLDRAMRRILAMPGAPA